MKRESPGQKTIVYPAVENHFLPSRHVDQIFKIQIMLPPHPKGELPVLPVVYMTDANIMFEAARAAAYGLEHDFILVGIGYPSDMPFAGARLRARDLSFPGYPDLGLQPPDIEGVLPTPEGAPTFYGSESFLRFLTEELIPFVEGRYATKLEQRCYFGHSLGAGFGLHCLASRAGLFSRYVLSSPGLSYHGVTPGGCAYRDYDFAIQMIREFAASAPILPGVRLYMSVGSEEELEPGLGAWRLTSSFNRTVSVLRALAIAGLEIRTEILEGETHGTAWFSSFVRGIRSVCADGQAAMEGAAGTHS